MNDWNPRIHLLGFLAAYLVVVGAVVALVCWGRQWALAELASPAAKVQWEKWREDVQAGRDPQAGTVQRRVPQSSEPPGLVLMRDYFAVCLTGAVLFTSLLFLATTWLLVGAIASGPLTNGTGTEADRSSENVESEGPHEQFRREV